MTPAGFELAIPESERPQTHSLDRSATGTGKKELQIKNKGFSLWCALRKGSLRERGHWGDQDVDGRIDFQEVGGGRGDWMELAQDRDRWRAVVGTVRNFRVP
jgi:hypothetical protein